MLVWENYLWISGQAAKRAKMRVRKGR